MPLGWSGNRVSFVVMAIIETVAGARSASEPMSTIIAELFDAMRFVGQPDDQSRVTVGPARK
jgi:hypothetical protein